MPPKAKTPSKNKSGSKTKLASKPQSRRKAPAAKMPNVRLTHPDRVLYPDEGITKGDLAEYYVAVADWILPHLGNRPLSLVRCPAGMSGPCFFQKHPPTGLSADVGRMQIQEKSQLGTYLVIDNLAGLISVIQFGALELHVWGALADDVERPDRLVFDLDPDPSVPWKRVIDAAFLVRDLLEQCGLKSFVKTSGGKGLHVVVPIARKQTWAEAGEFARSVADALVRFAPKQFVANMSKAARRDKIFIDYLRNQRGATSVVAYSSRAKRGAPVSFPLDWDDLRSLKGPAQFTLQNVPAILAKARRDPWKELPKLRQTITAAAKRKLRG